MLLEKISKLTFPIAEMSFHRAIREKFDLIKQEMAQPYSVRKARQLQKLHHQLKLAQLKVPYYQDLFKKKKFNPDLVLKDIRYFEELPYLDKETVRTELKRFINVDYDIKKLIIRETNGSTGPTIPVFYNLEALDWSSAVNLYTNFILGKSPSKKEIYIEPNELIERNISERLIDIFKSITLNRKNLRYKTLDDDELDRLCRKLKQAKPLLVLSTPTTFNALARYVKRNPRRSLSLNTLISTGEILDDLKKKEIEKYLKCRIFNRLGNAEIGIYAHDTLTEQLAIIDSVAFVETALDPTSSSSQIIITNLKNDAMPLIRYKTGDLGEKVVNEHGEFLKNIYGRVHEILYINGESIHTNLVKETLFKIGNVDDFQIHKSAEHGYLLKIVADTNFRSSIREKIRQIWGMNFEIEFTSVDQLSQVGLRRKFQYFIDDTMTHGERK